MLTDEQVLARAAEAGWVWYEPVERGRWGGVPGWQTSSHSFSSCSRADPQYSKMAVARKSFDHDRRCLECNTPKDANWDHVSTIHCSTCNFWLRLVGKDEELRVVVGGVHYYANRWWAPDEPPPGYGERRYFGFGGDKWTAVFHAGPNAGQTLTTYDLWHQGKTPERFRDRLPDNATWEVRAGVAKS